MKTAPLILVLSLLILFSYSEAFSANPAPYTEEAYKKIEAEAKMNKSIYDANLSKEENLRKTVELFRSIYSKAGYNYDDTIIKVVDDMRHHPERIPNNPYSVPTMIYVGVHIMMSECNYVNVDCLKFFSSDTAEAIIWLIKNTEFKF
ncbi:MAG: hypothetical protein AB1480_01690 [Nitrospirota bacterium]